MARERKGLLNPEEWDIWMNLSRSVGIKGFSRMKLRRIPRAVVKANVVKREGTRQGPLPPRVKDGSASLHSEPWAHAHASPSPGGLGFLPAAPTTSFWNFCSLQPFAPDFDFAQLRLWVCFSTLNPHLVSSHPDGPRQLKQIQFKDSTTGI